ncbi:MAG: hypothetical protein JW821_01120 [Deltaproteobacteria bacterium]|nr:hypothetical protein [Deltaproteobacteria bacterium]
MSSILKALKKVEKQGAKQDVIPTFPQKIDTKKSVNQRVRGPWLLHRLLTGVLILVILVGGAWFLWTHGRSMMGPPVSGKDAPPVQGEEARVAAVAMPVEKGEAPQGPGKEVGKITAGQPAPAERPPAEPGPAPVPEKRPPAEAPVIPGAPPATKVAVSPAPVASVKAAPLSSPARRQVPERPVDEGAYKLEAVVWSKDPAGRFAVINGQIVRAGGAVGDLSVREIGRDFVAVRSGDRDWEMRFTVE